MNHSQRLKLADKIGKEIIQKYGKSNILSVGFYGSTARNEDNEFSDLELIIITKNKEFMEHYIHKDMTVTIYGISFKHAIRMIREVDEQWSLKSSFLIYQKVIFGDRRIISRFKEKIKSVKKVDLRKAANEQIIFMHENLNKIKSAAKLKSRGKMLFALLFYTIQANLLVGLLNKHIFKRQGFDALREIKNLKILPKDYYKLMMILYESTDLDKVAKAASELFDNCMKLLK
jgi:predicted nucleotidyltransferase